MYAVYKSHSYIYIFMHLTHYQTGTNVVPGEAVAGLLGLILWLDLSVLSSKGTKSMSEGGKWIANNQSAISFPSEGNANKFPVGQHITVFKDLSLVFLFTVAPISKSDGISFTNINTYSTHIRTKPLHVKILIPKAPLKNEQCQLQLLLENLRETTVS